MKVRVRRVMSGDIFVHPYKVQYKNGWWPFWLQSRSFLTRDGAVRYAKDLLADQTIKIT